jgi:hypothetical protein
MEALNSSNDVISEVICIEHGLYVAENLVHDPRIQFVMMINCLCTGVGLMAWSPLTMGLVSGKLEDGVPLFARSSFKVCPTWSNFLMIVPPYSYIFTKFMYISSNFSRSVFVCYLLPSSCFSFSPFITYLFCPLP